MEVGRGEGGGVVSHAKYTYPNQRLLSLTI